MFAPACTCCGVAYGGDVRLFRCSQCGEFLQCLDCVRSGHQLNPLHSIKEWNGSHWTEAQLSGGEGSLGIVYQLGHHGHACDFPDARERTMVVMDITGVHKVTYRFCACEKARRFVNGTLGQLMGNAWYPATTVDPETCASFESLELFRLLNVVGNLNVHDFVRSLERRTDPLLVTKIPDRYKAFGRMSRQYAYLLRALRAGLAHLPGGLKTATPGSMAVLCWPCPQDEKNLPEGWREADPRYRFLYMLLLAMDANFRLKNRLRANENQEPSLCSGLGYFVEEKGYKKHIKNYVAEKDVGTASSCIAFAALLQKETRLTTGLRCSGVGGCVCARHGVVRPQGLGDLQKGERYANMDYILMSALVGVALVALTISYDIACQWKVNLPTRAAKIVKDAKLPTRLDEYEIQFALPVWHAAAHETTCQTQNSLSYTAGVGRTDGEGIERTWAILNPLGFSTKEMGYGARHDAIENKVDHLNFEKNIGQGDTLARKLIVAIAERDKQVAAFTEVDCTLSSKLRNKWQERIDEWLADKSQPNPYCLEAGPTEAAVLLELKTAEAAEAAEGREQVSDTKSTPTAFVKAGLQLEEAQRRIKAEIKGVTLVTADRASQIQEMRIAFHRKMRTYKRLQEVYMPGVRALKLAAEEARDPDAPPPKAEEMKLWLPSEILEALRSRACRKGLSDIEARLRAAQCVDALNVLRSRLHAQTHLISWRNSNSTGQRAATRSATLIGRVGDRIKRAAGKYRRAREALIALKGAAHTLEFKVLADADLNTNVEEESDAEARRKLARLGSSKRARNEPTNKKTTLSWIWTVGGGPGEAEAQLHECKCRLIVREPVRVEWSKAKARRDRWVEEVQLLREEMKRVLRMLRWTQGEWEKREGQRDSVDPELAAGLKAYARRQVYIHKRVAEAFHTGWNCSLASAVRQVMERDGLVHQELLRGAGVDKALAVEFTAMETNVANDG
ncbi:hypothetical protein C8F04DRAFT_948846 [Mycena alexandri]|uniref:CxC2-like cysteine cluster KDZ transposase-associated domain-containing protein n=1 Tax=Mycena alexandri TaxID=1745969 RepID=A0AAD6T741_9AGAR|nr:hypothetical protein C8F04DRAFT_948846 [Mycena alexandri]